jgi:hypothetical protein
VRKEVNIMKAKSSPYIVLGGKAQQIMKTPKVGFFNFIISLQTVNASRKALLSYSAMTSWVWVWGYLVPSLPNIRREESVSRTKKKENHHPSS